MTLLRPHVIIDQTPRRPLLTRIAGVIDLAIREMPICEAKVERTASGNAMITSEHPMHQDMLIVHGYPSVPNKIRVVNRLGDLAINLVSPAMDRAASAGLECGRGDDALPRALEVLNLTSVMLHASTDAKLAYRRATMRHDARMLSIGRRLDAIGTLVLTTTESRDTALIEAPTPWSSLCDGTTGPIEHGRALWGRMRPVLSLSVLGVDSARNAWSIEMKPIGREVSKEDDPMAVLRVLSSLPKAARLAA
jgi:hypothetical protein